MDEQGPVGVEDRAPMLLRKVPPERRHLARSMTAPEVDPPEGTWWELVDAAADGELPAAAVVLTHEEPGGCVAVSALGARDDDAEDAYGQLLRALVATLRSRSVDSIVVRATERAVVRAVLAAEFTPDPDADGDRYVIAL